MWAVAPHWLARKTGSTHSGLESVLEKRCGSQDKSALRNPGPPPHTQPTTQPTDSTIYTDPHTTRRQTDRSTDRSTCCWCWCWCRRLKAHASVQARTFHAATSGLRDTSGQVSGVCATRPRPMAGSSSPVLVHRASKTISLPDV